MTAMAQNRGRWHGNVSIQCIASESTIHKVMLTEFCVTQENHGVQKNRFDEIGQSLRQHKVSLEVEFSRTLHDREIR